MTPFLALITPIGDAGAPPPGSGGPPVGIWPGPGPLPGVGHPIAPGGQPPSVWPSPGHPAHPIVLPPDLPTVPPSTVWPNPPEGVAPMPEHPIYYPKPEPPAGTVIDWKVIWLPETGWALIGVPNVPHPVPSEGSKR